MLGKAAGGELGQRFGVGDPVALDLRELLVATGQHTQRDLGRDGGIGDPTAIGAPGGASGDQMPDGQTAQLVTQRLGGGDDQRFDLLLDAMAVFISRRHAI